jgi:gamma-butyrobetaine dioxygenase
LEPHVDLAYCEAPPGLQILHCAAFDAAVAGGESTLLDGWHAAELLRARDPAAFATLGRVPAGFEKVHYAREVPVHMTAERPHFALREGEVAAIFWAPMFEAPLRARCARRALGALFRAKAAFARVLRGLERDGSGAFLEARLEVGEALVFNNRRMLHGRRAIAGPGARRLVGAYVGADEWRSRLAVLRAQRGEAGPPMRRVGDGNVL